MRNWTKAVLLGAGLLGAVTAAGCADDYYDDGGSYGHHDSYYGDRSYDHGYRNDDSYRNDRVRVCDADGDDCHWEHRR